MSNTKLVVAQKNARKVDFLVNTLEKNTCVFKGLAPEDFTGFAKKILEIDKDYSLLFSFLPPADKLEITEFLAAAAADAEDKEVVETGRSGYFIPYVPDTTSIWFNGQELVSQEEQMRGLVAAYRCKVLKLFGVTEVDSNGKKLSGNLELGENRRPVAVKIAKPLVDKDNRIVETINQYHERTLETNITSFKQLFGRLVDADTFADKATI